MEANAQTADPSAGQVRYAVTVTTADRRGAGTEVGTGHEGGGGLLLVYNSFFCYSLV